MNRENLLQPVIDVARRAGEETARIYKDDSAWVQEKEDGSPLTAADMASHSIIVEGLAALDAAIPVLSEEGEPPSWEERQAWTRYWLIDPLDGTKEFVGRTGEFTVNIALIDKGEPVLGVVVAPMFDLTYAAVAGLPAKCIAKGESRTIAVRQVPRPPVLVASRRHKGGKNAAFSELLTERLGPLERMDRGSSLKMCQIAEGSADIYPRFGPTCEWDTGAADAVLRAAGGALLDSELNPLRYNSKESLLNPDFVALGQIEDWPFLAECWPE